MKKLMFCEDFEVIWGREDNLWMDGLFDESRKTLLEIKFYYDLD